MGISRLVHRRLVSDLVLQCQVKPRVFLGWGPASCNQNLVWSKGDGGRALVELACTAVAQFFYRPLIFVHVITKAYLRVDIVAEEINARYLVLGALGLRKNT